MALYISVYKGKTKKKICMLLSDNAYVYICIYISMCCMYCTYISYSNLLQTKLFTIFPFFIKNTKNIKNIFSFLKCYHILDITFSELRDREPYDVHKKKNFNMHRVRLFFGLAFGEFFFNLLDL